MHKPCIWFRASWQAKQWKIKNHISSKFITKCSRDTQPFLKLKVRKFLLCFSKESNVKLVPCKTALMVTIKYLMNSVFTELMSNPYSHFVLWKWNGISDRLVMVAATARQLLGTIEVHLHLILPSEHMNPGIIVESFGWSTSVPRPGSSTPHF